MEWIQLPNSHMYHCHQLSWSSFSCPSRKPNRRESGILIRLRKAQGDPRTDLHFIEVPVKERIRKQSDKIQTICVCVFFFSYRYSVGFEVSVKYSFNDEVSILELLQIPIVFTTFFVVLHLFESISQSVLNTI